MKNEKLNDLDEFDFLYEEIEPQFHQDIMVQQLEKRRTIILPNEISKRKKIIKKMFETRFGKKFFKFKPESLEELEYQLKKYYFSPHSEFLHNFPKLRKQFRNSKKINYNELGSKINVGSLLYLNETEKKKKAKKEMLNKKEKMITFSKNFETKATKDVINTEVYKVKFWDKNSRRIKRLLSRRNNEMNKELNDDSINNSEEEDEYKDNDNKFYCKTSVNFNIKNKENEKNNYLSLDNNKKQKFEYDNIENSKLSYMDTKNNQNNNTVKNSYMNNFKLYTVNKSILKKKNINLSKETSFPSLLVNSNINTSVNNSKQLNLKLISRNNKANNLQKSFLSTYKSFNHISKKKLIESSLKYKRNLTKQVKDLNIHTIKCNSKLYKLIDGNFIENSREIIKRKKQDFDIGNDLYDKDNKNKYYNNNKTFFDYYEYEKLKANKNDNNYINSLIKEAKNNNSEEYKFKKRELKLFPKKIVKINDDYALQLVERLFSAHKISKEKPPELKEVFKEDKEIKHKKKINTLRKKAKYNHDKIIRMGFFLAKEKDRFFAINKMTKK